MPGSNTASRMPKILLFAGMEQPGPDHWMRLWEKRGDCALTELGIWNMPHRNSWVTAIGHAVQRAGGPVILVARGLACHAVAWWAQMERPAYGDPVAGAMLVAPPNVDSASADLRTAALGPAPKALLPFPSVVVTSRNDPRMTAAGAQTLARFWGSHCVDGGEIGSANAASDLGEWEHGRRILDGLLSRNVLDTTLSTGALNDALPPDFTRSAPFRADMSL